MAVLKMFKALSIIITVAYFINADSKMDPKVANGIPTTIDKFPHSVLLFVWRRDGNWRCGASVLNQAVTLTAAHCVKNKDNNMTDGMEIFAGHEVYTKSTVRRRVKTFVSHPAYKHNRHDIAIIILKRPLPLGDKIKRVIIKAQFPDDDMAVVAGWGLIHDNIPSKLLHTDYQNILPRELCAKYFRKKYIGIFCAGDLKGVLGRSTRGDSGSALMVRSQQIGIVSFSLSEPGASSAYGMVYYVNISYYYTWIKVIAKTKYCKLNKKVHFE